MRSCQPLLLAEQLHLFDPPPMRPRWEKLPLQTRREAVELMARMMREHRSGRREAVTAEEGRDE